MRLDRWEDPDTGTRVFQLLFSRWDATVCDLSEADWAELMALDQRGTVADLLAGLALLARRVQEALDKKK